MNVKKSSYKYNNVLLIQVGKKYRILSIDRDWLGLSEDQLRHPPAIHHPTH